MKKFVHWLDERLDLEQFRIAVGHDMREFALLWLVFSVLDLLVDDKLTFRWMFSNGLCCVVIWTFGSYIEMRRSVKERHDE